MPAKRNKKETGEKQPPKKIAFSTTCANPSPGPKYKLANLVGYKDHDTTKYRMPAYSFKRRQHGFDTCAGPGPKYMVKLNRFGPYTLPAYTFGYAATNLSNACGPGPKYMVRSLGPNSPSYTIKSRTEYRGGSQTPGPYAIMDKPRMPAYSLGMRPYGVRCGDSTGPKYGLCDLNVIKPRAPMYSMADRQTGNVSCSTPGPKYYPTMNIYKKYPVYSFGIKYSKCIPPHIVKCDERC